MGKIFHLISGPRNISTTMMYAFAQRSDTQVLDEPLYAHYLQHTHTQHPGTKDILQQQEQNANKVVNTIMAATNNIHHLFVKQMAHHLVNMNIDFLNHPDVYNIFLIRHPGFVIQSFEKVINHPNINDIGIKRQAELYDFCVKNDANYCVIDAHDVLKRPQIQLQKLCAALKASFQPTMMEWEQGPKSYDGIWAKYWYANVHQSTGFKPFKKRKFKINKHTDSLLKESLIYYEQLYKRRIMID